jgi:hypothetical protein
MGICRSGGEDSTYARESPCVNTRCRVPESAFGVDAEFRKSFHRPSQYSFVAARHDRSLYQFGMVRHDPNNLIVTQASSGYILSICFLVRSHGVLWSYPSTAKQLLERVDGERLSQVVDGLVIHTVRGQDPLDLAALASSRLLVDRHLGDRRHFFPRLLAESIWRRQSSLEHILPLRNVLIHPDCGNLSCSGWSQQFLPMCGGTSDRRFPDLRQSSQGERRHGDEKIANRNVEEGAHGDQV